MKKLSDLTGLELKWIQPALVEIDRNKVGPPDLPWLVMLGWYLVVILEMDSAAVFIGAGS